MLKINYMSTLFVGIDVSSKSNALYAMDFEENKYISSSFGNIQPGADGLVGMIADCMQNHKNLDTVIVCLESTSVGNIYGAASSAILANFLSPQEIIGLSDEELLTFLAEKSRNHIPDISRTSELLRKAARDSYRLDKCMYELLNVSLASSFNCIQAYQKEIKLIEQAIEKCINGMNPNAFLILKSIPGIGPVWASGILSEIGDITAFHSSDALAKYAGLYWLKNDSGDFTSENNTVSKAANPYLHYHLGEAANSVRRYVPEYADYYAKKYAEVSKHQHKRALALTFRKFVRLVFGLLVKKQLYIGEKLDTEHNIESNRPSVL